MRFSLVFLALSWRLALVSAEIKTPLTWVDATEIVCNQQAKVGTDLDTVGLKRDQIHVLSLFRTSPNPVKLKFALMDSRSPPKPIMPNKTLTLEAVTTGERRLGSEAIIRDTIHFSLDGNLSTVTEILPLASPGAKGAPVEAAEVRPGELDEAGACEDFFLSDGRSPVELPDTWGEAVTSFQDICEQELFDERQCSADVERLFEGFEGDSEVLFRPSPKLCSSIMAHALENWGLSVLKSRRLKGGGTTSGGAAAGASRTSSMSGGMSYGYSKTALTRSYPMGYRTTPYGYTGVSRLGTAGRVGIFAGAGIGAYGMWRLSRGGYTREGEEGEYAPTTEDLIQNDFMDAGFFPKDFQSPLKFWLFEISGDDFKATDICPPIGWEPPASGEAHPTWNPPANGELFAALSAMEEINHEDEMGGVVVVIMMGISVVLGVFIWCCCCSKTARHHKKMKKMASCREIPCTPGALEGQIQPKIMLGGRAEYYVLGTGLGTYLGCAGQPNQMSGNVNYDLSISDAGRISGSATSECLGQLKVVGRMEMNGQQGICNWEETGNNYTAEVEGVLTKTAGLTFVGGVYGFAGPEHGITNGNLNLQAGNVALRTSGVTIGSTH